MDKYIFTDELSFDARILNLVCIVGVLALLVSFLGHVIERSNWIMMLLKIVMILGGLLLIFVCNKYNLHKYGRVVAIISFCDIFFPLVFFVNGGSYSGMAAYFVLTMILIVLLSKGKTFFIFMGIHLVIIIACYLTDRYYDIAIIPFTTPFQHYADNIISIVIAGIFIGLIIKGVSALFMREKAKAEAASKAKGDFLAQMSHEMRTPMNAIIGMASILAASDDIKQHEIGMKKIETASTHLLGVINDILDMSKIEANKLELFEEAFDFQRMVDDILMVVNFNLANKRQEFVVTIDPDIPRYFKGDKQRLSQVITNLLSNAIKFTPPKGKICLTVQLTNAQDNIYAIRFIVSDTGIGITEEQIERLFHSFEQADNSTSRRFGGTGLGLAISKQIIDLMGGEIWAKSEPGQGSTFTIDINLPVSDAPSKTAAEQNIESYDFTGKTLLIAEDIDINREIVTTLLEPTNITIECAANGKEAVEMYKAGNGKYQLIFMDIQMPEMDGYEATRAIRASGTPDAMQIPIIAMTANVFKEDIDKAKEAGMNDHLGKPIVLKDVLSKLANYLS
ncbi:MAG: response regulator [Clostridiales Family XIII bacterium]|nr:response regulator [Clostridiales Family XIII bacterium]